MQACPVCGVDSSQILPVRHRLPFKQHTGRHYMAIYGRLVCTGLWSASISTTIGIESGYNSFLSSWSLMNTGNDIQRVLEDGNLKDWQAMPLLPVSKYKAVIFNLCIFQFMPYCSNLVTLSVAQERISKKCRSSRNFLTREQIPELRFSSSH